MSVVGLSQSACLIITQATRLCESWLELPLLLPALELDPLPLHRLGPEPGLLQRRIQTLNVDGAGARFAKNIANQQLLSLARQDKPSN